LLRAGQGQQLRDLIFRKEGETDVDREAYVQLVFRKLAEDEEDLDDDGDDVDDYETMTFRRKITSSGASEYKVNGKTVSWDRYSDALGEIGVNVKSRRFLVFQGDVESIAGMAPKDLTTYFEKASGSDELKREYDAADAARSESEENYLFHFQKKKGMAAEKKQIKEQQEEANKYKQLKETLEQKTVEHFLYELFHVQESVQNLETEIEGHIEELDAKEAERQQVEAKMKEAKKQQSVLQRQATLHSKKIVDMEKELSKQQPNEVSLKEGIKRLAKRSTKHLKQQAKLEGELETQQSLLQELRRSLESVRHDQDEFEKSAKESASKAIQLEESQIQEYHQRKEEAAAGSGSPLPAS
jgi:structural maintenance of chromosome 1